VKWLEHPTDAGERLLREGLDQAAQRTGDEITHRRVWAKVADALLVPVAGVSGRLVFVSASVAMTALAVTALIVYPYLGSKSHATSAASAAPTRPSAAASDPRVREPAAGSGGAMGQGESEHAAGSVVRTGKGERARVSLGGGAVADLDESSAVTWDAQHRPGILFGNARLSVPHQPPGWRFSVTAGPYVVTVIGTKFKVEVGGQSVGVEVEEGVVEVWHGSHSTRLVAGDAWHGPSRPEETSTQSGGQAGRMTHLAYKAPSEGPDMPLVSAQPLPAASRGLGDVESVLDTGDVARAMAMLGRTAQGSGPAAENAAYEMARITRYNLGQPRQAIALWDKYRTRFPDGLLRTEADLSIVDTLARLGEVRSALDEATTFIARHPSSERRAEIHRLIDRLRASEAGSESR